MKQTSKARERSITEFAREMRVIQMQDFPSSKILHGVWKEQRQMMRQMQMRSVRILQVSRSRAKRSQETSIVDGKRCKGRRRSKGFWVFFSGRSDGREKGVRLQLFGCCADDGLRKAKQAMSDGDGDDGELGRKGKKEEKKRRHQNK